jgi:UDP-N-acetylglucosamine 2-epimerase (non-hydrolysing)
MTEERAGTGVVRTLLVTVHRRESFGARLDGICRAVRRIATERDVRVVLPVHPNPAVREPVGRILADAPNVRLIAPVAYAELIRLLSQSYFVLTDSGGLQEEGPALGKPVLVLRDTTERPEAVEAGAAILVGRDPARIVTEACRLLDDRSRYEAMAVPRPIFGDGRAAPRIVDALVGAQVRSTVTAR